MLELIIEIAAFFLVLFFLVPFLLFSFWLHHISHRELHDFWREGDHSGQARH